MDKRGKITKMGNCVYCKCRIDDDRAVDVCDVCGRRVWGDKMFLAIKTNMSSAQDRGDLHQGLVTLNSFENTNKKL